MALHSLVLMMSKLTVITPLMTAGHSTKQSAWTLAWHSAAERDTIVISLAFSQSYIIPHPDWLSIGRAIQCGNNSVAYSFARIEKSGSEMEKVKYIQSFFCVLDLHILTMLITLQSSDVTVWPAQPLFINRQSELSELKILTEHKH